MRVQHCHQPITLSYIVHLQFAVVVVKMAVMLLCYPSFSTVSSCVHATHGTGRLEQVTRSLSSRSLGPSPVMVAPSKQNLESAVNKEHR